MAWLHAAPKHHNKHENPPSRLESLHEDDPVRELPEADFYITKCFDLMGLCSYSGMGMTPFTWVDVDAFCNVSGYRLSGWQAEQVVLMSRAYCRMAHEARKLSCPAPYNQAASDEAALQRNRDKVNQQFMMMKRKQK